jgi:hypothetical protein
MDDQGHTALMERIERLERQARRHKIVSLGLVISLGAFLLMGNASVPDAIVAKRFVVVDKQGKRRAVLGFEDREGASLRLYKSDERVAAALEASDTSGSLTLYGSGKGEAALYSDEDGAAVDLRDSRTKSNVFVSAGGGQPSLNISDESCVLRIDLGILSDSLTTPGNFPLLRFHNKNERTLALLGVVDGLPKLTLSDEARKNVIGMVVADSPKLILYANGKMVWQAR